MVVKRKSSRGPIAQQDHEEMVGKVIDRGGSTAVDPFAQERASFKRKEMCFTLRIQADLIKKVDCTRKNRIGNISRNQWIIEAINKAIEEEENEDN